MLYLMLEILFWVALVQVWRYRGKIKESTVVNGAEHELTKLYIENKNNWTIVMCVSFAASIFLPIVLF